MRFTGQILFVYTIFPRLKAGKTAELLKGRDRVGCYDDPYHETIYTFVSQDISTPFILP